ncbi:MAG: hypothetical protein VX024_12495, partial [SAR324 cluster bacterium]|nr:hypothetical protein [SAR324 cluster bacterium]
ILSAPIVVNIALYHVFLAQSGLGIAIVLVCLELYLAFRYRNVFVPLFQMRPSPANSQLQTFEIFSGRHSAI